MEQSSIKIGLDKVSPKLLIGQCLDMSQKVLQEIVQVYCNNNSYQFPLPNQNNDLLGYINYIVDMSRYDKIAQTFLKDNKNFVKAFLKSWLFELKALRNAWAHSTNQQEFDFRLVCRAFDTLSLVYLGFKGHPEYQLYQKIEFYRQHLLCFSVQQLKKGIH